MNRPSKFQIMCANRHRKPKVEALIDGVQSDVESEWAAYRAQVEADRRAQYVDTGDWIRATREEARATKAAEPGQREQRRRRWWWPFGRRAAAC